VYLLYAGAAAQACVVTGAAGTFSRRAALDEADARTAAAYRILRWMPHAEEQR
jgi:hypothetical protein